MDVVVLGHDVLVAVCHVAMALVLVHSGVSVHVEHKLDGDGEAAGIGTHLWRWIAWPHSLGIGRSHRSHRISIGRSTLIRSGHLWLRHRAIPRCFGCHGVAVRHRGSRGSRGRGRRGRRDQTASRGIGHGHGRSSLDVPADRWRIQ